MKQPRQVRWRHLVLTNTVCKFRINFRVAIHGQFEGCGERHAD